jgi:hypothetical protein
VALEDDRYVIDDFIALGVTPLARLSDGYAGCKGGQWVGRPGDHPRSTPEDAPVVSNEVSHALIGKQITIRGKFSLRGKFGAYVVLDNQQVVDLEPR